LTALGSTRIAGSAPQSRLPALRKPVIDPLMKPAVLVMRARIINTVVACLIGLLFIAIGDPALIMLPIAMAITVLLSS
jgi:hypothetical protein